MAETVETAIYRLQIEGQEQIDAMKKSIDGLAVSEDKLTASNRVTTDAIEKRIASYDPLLRAQQTYRKELEYIEQVQASGVGTQQQINALFEGATAKYEKATAAAKELGDAHKGLDSQGQAAFHSMRSMVEQLAMGVPITQVLTQQLNHLSYAASGEGGIAGAFKQVGTFISGMISPTTALIAAVTALGAAALYAANQFDKLQVSSQRAISGAGARTGTTAEDINKFMQQNAGQGSGVSDKEARDLAEAWTQSGEIVISQLHDVGTALVGFANQTSSSVTDASKAFESFGKDPAKALQAFKDAFGALDQTTLHSIQSLIEAGDKTGALQAIFNAYSGELKDAANNMGFMEKATRALIVAMGGIPKLFLPEGIDTQIANTKKELDELIASAEKTPPDAFLPGISQAIVDLTDKLIKLQAELDKTRGKTATAVSNDIADKANAATRALDPEIGQLEALRQKIKEIEAAQAAGLGTDAMAAALERARLKVEQLTGTMSANAVAASQWAQQLTTNVSALGSAATAEETANAKIAALTAQFDAGTISAGVYSRAVAGITDAYNAAIPVTQGMIAAQSTLGDLMRQNIGGQISLPDITQQAAGYGQDLANSFQDAGVQGKVLYDNTSGASNSAATLAGNLNNGAQGADQIANSLASAANSASTLGSSLAGIYAKGADPFASLLGDTSGSGGGGTIGSLNLIPSPSGYRVPGTPQDIAIANQSAIDQAKIKANASGGGGGGGGSVADQLAFWQSLPESSAGDLVIKQLKDQMASLTSSTDSLTKSTDSLNATNSELLSPYYNQDPRTSHIGFRSQGMASGGYVDVPGGSSVNDNMLLTMPVASGERVFVDPMTGVRNGTTGSVTINISSPIVVPAGTNTDQIGRTLFQNNQSMAKQIRAAMPS